MREIIWVTPLLLLLLSYFFLLFFFFLLFLFFFIFQLLFLLFPSPLNADQFVVDDNDNDDDDDDFPDHDNDDNDEEGLFLGGVVVLADVGSSDFEAHVSSEVDVVSISLPNHLPNPPPPHHRRRPRPKRRRRRGGGGHFGERWRPRPWRRIGRCLLRGRRQLRRPDEARWDPACSNSSRCRTRSSCGLSEDDPLPPQPSSSLSFSPAETCNIYRPWALDRPFLYE